MQTKILYFIFLSCLISAACIAQKKKVVYLDTLGNQIEFIGALSIMNTGHYKWKSDESDKNTRYLKWERTSDETFDSLVARTRERSAITGKIGTVFKPFGDVVDINGRSYKEAELKGKVIVINFWFVGCGPCEVEMPELNKLMDKYRRSQDVVFISFAKSSESKIRKFLVEKLFSYPVIAMSKEMSGEFKISSFPTNYIIGRDGNYQYASHGIGAGGVHILDGEIALAVKK